MVHNSNCCKFGCFPNSDEQIVNFSDCYVVTCTRCEILQRNSSAILRPPSAIFHNSSAILKSMSFRFPKRSEVGLHTIFHSWVSAQVVGNCTALAIDRRNHVSTYLFTDRLLFTHMNRSILSVNHIDPEFHLV